MLRSIASAALAAVLGTGLLLASSVLTGCAGVGKIQGNELGSSPINKTEALEYKKAIVRCYKTGGSRVVKIMGQLRCY